MDKFYKKAFVCSSISFIIYVFCFFILQIIPNNFEPPQEYTTEVSYDAIMCGGETWTHNSLDDVYNYVPHGFCWNWNWEFIQFHLLADLITFICYMIGPIALLHIIYKRRDTAGTFLHLLISALVFVIACGFNHITAALNVLWNFYVLDLFTKNIMSFVSIYFVVAILIEYKNILKLNTAEEIETKTRRLQNKLNKCELEYSKLKRTNSVELLTNNIVNMYKPQVINIDDFSVNVGDTVNISEIKEAPIMTTLIKKDNNYLEFKVSFFKNSKLNCHIHNKYYEVIVVNQGEIIDIYNGKKFVKGDKYIIEKEQAHEIISIGGADLTIYFIKDLNQLPDEYKD